MCFYKINQCPFKTERYCKFLMQYSRSLNIINPLENKDFNISTVDFIDCLGLNSYLKKIMF